MERLRTIGARDVRLQPFRFQRSWGARQLVPLAAGIAAAARGGRAGAATALAALAAYDGDFTGQASLLARLVPASGGWNVSARLASAGEPRRTLVLVAHHDAARTGLAWRLAPLTTRAGEDGVSSFAELPEAALAAVTAGSLAHSRRLRIAAAAALGAVVALTLDVMRGDSVPGANDNASGVAGVLALAERFARAPLDETEVRVVLPGCEESGMGGMRAWLDGDGRSLDRAATLVVGLDTIGSGEPVVASAEGGLRRVVYAPADLAWAERAAAAAGLEPPRRYRLGAWTDPALAALGGFRALSLLSVRDGRFTNYHLPSDTPERVDWDSVVACTRLAEALARAFARC